MKFCACGKTTEGQCTCNCQVVAGNHFSGVVETQPDEVKRTKLQAYGPNGKFGVYEFVLAIEFDKVVAQLADARAETEAWRLEASQRLPGSERNGALAEPVSGGAVLPAAKFEREERYMVVKLSKLGKDEADESERREQIYRIAHFGKALVECVVVESDWPEYQRTWAAIKRRTQREGEQQ